jgi:hypothetical protein
MVTTGLPYGLRIGEHNVATSITKLAGAAGVDGPMLGINNNNSGPNATALELQVEPGKPPLSVDSSVKVDNLNADALDGLDSSEFSRVAHAHDDRYYTESESNARYLAANGKAADADKLDGRELSSGRVTRNQPAVSGSAFRLLEAGALRLVAACTNTQSGAFANVRIETAQPDSAASAHSVELGGVEIPALDPGDTPSVASTGPATASSALDHATYSAVAPNGDTLQGEVFVGVNLQGSTCVYSASGID